MVACGCCAIGEVGNGNTKGWGGSDERALRDFFCKRFEIPHEFWPGECQGDNGKGSEYVGAPFLEGRGGEFYDPTGGAGRCDFVSPNHFRGGYDGEGCHSCSQWVFCKGFSVF